MGAQLVVMPRAPGAQLVVMVPKVRVPFFTLDGYVSVHGNGHEDTMIRRFDDDAQAMVAGHRIGDRLVWAVEEVMQ